MNNTMEKKHPYQHPPDDGHMKGTALFVAALSSLLVPFISSSINIALPSITREFRLTAIATGWVPTAFLLSAAVFLVPLGKVADVYGRKRVFVCGMAILTVSSILGAAAGSGWVLILSRVVQGVGAAMIFGTTVAILTSVYPPGERGFALGVTVAAVYVGLSLGPFVGGFLTQHVGWRSIFVVNIPICFAVMAAAFFGLKREWAEGRKGSYDFVGAFIYGLALVAIMYGFSLLPSPYGFVSVFLGMCGLFGFVRWESRVADPLVNIDLFRNNRVFAFSNLAALISYSATFAISFLLSLYLQYIKGMSAQSAGVVLVTQPVVQALFSPFAGRLSDKVEPRVVASAGMALTVIGLLVCSLFAYPTPLSLVLGALATLGLGFALFSSPNTNAIMGSVDRQFFGIASGMVATMRLMGQMVSMGVTVLMFALYLGSARISEPLYPLFLESMRAIFLSFAGLCLVGVVASLYRGRMR
jgi:EmrB/QacA subfamily drug resistance transporter